MRIAFLTFVLCSTALHAQNLPPTVAITGVGLDQGAQTVTITYTLSDPENDACTVRLAASNNGGTTFLLNTSATTGALGEGISPGTALSMVWNYGGLDPAGLLVRVSAEDGHTPDIQAMVDALDAERLMQRMTDVAVPRYHVTTPNGLNAIRDTLVQTFEAAGLQTTLQNVTFGTTTVPNVIGRLPGLVDEARTYLVDGHYDAVSGTAGADDNATAVAATLEIARILAPYRFKHSIRFVGFSFEEQGLIGSQAFVQNAIPVWEELEGVLNMEMIGYYSDEPNSQELPAGFELLFPAAVADITADEFRGNFLTVVGNTASQPLVDAFVSAGQQYVPDLRMIPLAVPGNGQIAPDLRRSDHTPFWESGRQALMLTDGSNFRNANYHTPGDVPATIDTLFYTRSAKATLATLATLAEPLNMGSDSYALADAVGVHDHATTSICNATASYEATTQRVRIQFDACNTHRLTATLFDARGARLAGRTVDPAAGIQEIPVGTLATGMHLLVLQDGEASRTLKVEVVR